MNIQPVKLTIALVEKNLSPGIDYQLLFLEISSSTPHPLPNTPVPLLKGERGTSSLLFPLSSKKMGYLICINGHELMTVV